MGWANNAEMKTNLQVEAAELLIKKTFKLPWHLALLCVLVCVRVRLLFKRASQNRVVQKQEPQGSKWSLSLSVPCSLSSFSGLDSLSHL